MEFYAVTGRPILHSRSPEIFRRLFQQYNLPAAYSRIKATTPEEVLALMQILGVSGLNVTAPLKEKLLPYLTETDEVVKQIGSINLVKKLGSELLGGNGDPSGVLGPLAARGLQLSGKRVLLVGAGGAARAAAFALSGAGAQVTIANRTFGKAAALAAEFACRAIPLTEISRYLADCDILLSTIPTGADMIQKEWLKPATMVFDADYRHGSLAKTAAAFGCQTISGEEWLAQQALYSFHWLTGQTVSAGAASVKALAQLVLATKYKDKKNVALIGFMACGKTSIAQKLAERLNFTFFDADAEIEHLEGMTVAEIFKQKGEAYFRCREKEIVARLVNIQGMVFSSGGGAVLAEENRTILQQYAWTVWPVVSMDVTRSRLQPGTRPLLSGLLSNELPETLFRDRLPLYFQTADIIVNGEKKLAELCEEIYEEIHFTICN